jgi:hypothetical protein
LPTPLHDKVKIMNSMKRFAMVLALGSGGLWLLAPASVVMTSCGDSATGGGSGTGGGSATGGGSGTGGGSATGGGSGTGGGSATGGGSGTGGGSAMTDCFAGTPTTRLNFLNACTDTSVVRILKATPYRDGGVLSTATDFAAAYPR